MQQHQQQVLEVEHSLHKMQMQQLNQPISKQEMRRHLQTDQRTRRQQEEEVEAITEERKMLVKVGIMNKAKKKKKEGGGTPY